MSVKHKHDGEYSQTHIDFSNDKDPTMIFSTGIHGDSHVDDDRC